MKTFGWWRSRTVELTVAFMLVAAILIVAESVTKRQREAVPPEAWFVINEVYVPDYEAGTPPEEIEMIYDRTVLQEFRGFWVVEVQRQTRAGLWTTACAGNGVDEYDPEEEIEEDKVDWLWYIGRPCVMDIGTYRLRTTYDMSRPDWPTKRVFSLSNEFDVVPGP